MKLLRLLAANWRKNCPGKYRRAVVIRLEGLELASVDRYLEQGALHNLALLCDIGTRVELQNHRGFDQANFCANLADQGLPSMALPADASSSAADLDSICAADCAQQLRLIEALQRRTNVVVCTFDMVARLLRLFGPAPSQIEQLVIRDVYARMDEIVGKAFSFRDEPIALVVVVPFVCESRVDVFSNCRIGQSELNDADLSQMVLRLLKSEPAE